MAYFSRVGLSSLYEVEDILIDSDEAREDVERYLRHELGKLRPKYSALASATQWPPEGDFLKLSAGADGLFAFASTAVRFVDDPVSGNPVSQLKQVLEAIDNILSRPRNRNRHPLARLDALYSHILSRIPRHILPMTKELLLGLDSHPELSFSHLCSRLGMALDVAYGAVHQLHSVLNIPEPNVVAECRISILHKPFRDHLHDFKRSRMFPDRKSRCAEIEIRCASRIFNEISGGVNNGSDPTENISLYWESHIPFGSLTFFQMESQDRRSLGLTHLLKLFDIQLLESAERCVFWWNLFREDMHEELKEHQVIYEVPIGELDSSNIEGNQMVSVVFS
ncbi:hypothetical protein P691DRAFT_780199 [Macrolepiota fuliginosa MF-IS2]|uniref:Uncharacterized protein n=1 Tax=Macrolepiota fuliginosa MF-IS2 TaxID=1400762 RepID=A0A9P5WWW7_9AGAR|nr:hypothetical protein P691DRAFT_780199 [Macrolepiota fuliginosa MF-IS2]